MSFGHGSDEVKLTERGQKMANLLGVKLSEIEFNEIFSSDLRRAVETVKCIASFNEDIKSNHKEIQFVSDLREKNLGIFEGKDKKLIKEEAIKKNLPYRKFKPEGGESSIDVSIRIKNFLNSIIKKYVKQDFIDPDLLKIEGISGLSEQFNNTINIKKSKQVISNDIIKSNLLRNKNLYDNLKISKELKRDITISAGLNEDSFVADDKFKSLKPYMNDDNKNSSNKISNNLKESKTSTTSNKQFMYEEEKYEYFFLTCDLETLLLDSQTKKYIQTQYLGYSYNTLPRILMVSHSGLILEFFNIIRQRKGIDIKTTNDCKLASLFVLKIYCFNCGGICLSKKDCKIEYDLILYNSTQHLGKKIKI